MKRLTFALINDSSGAYMTGQASNAVVSLSKDGGAITTATSSVVEIGSGYYYIDLTNAEVTVTYGVLITITCTGAQSQAYYIDKEEYAKPGDAMTLTSDYNAAKTASQLTTSDIPTVSSIQSGLATSSDLATVDGIVDAIKAKTDNLPASPAATGDAMTLTSDYNAAKTASQLTTSDIPTVAQIQSGLAKTSDVPTVAQIQSGLAKTSDIPTVASIQSGLATSANVSSAVDTVKGYGDLKWGTADVSALATQTALDTIDGIVDAIKAKTDNLPASPAATGDAMTLTSDYNAAKTASQLTTSDIPTVASIQSGLAKTSDVPTVAQIQSGLAKTSDIPTVAQIQSGLATAAELAKCYSAMCHWSITGNTLTTYGSSGSTLQTFDLTKDASGNITAIEEAEEEDDE